MEDVLYRITSGYFVSRIGKKDYKICSPTAEAKSKAAELYRSTLEDTRFDLWMSEYEIKQTLIRCKLISPEIDENLPLIEKRIEELKVDLYENAYKFKEREKIQKQLDSVVKKQDEMLYNRHSLDMLTHKGYANSLKVQCAIALSLKTLDDNPVITNIYDVQKLSFPFVDCLIKEVNRNQISAKEFRKIAREEPWRSYWSISKENIFGASSLFLTDEQKYLILMSKMYDNAYAHPECPPDDIIENDDLFDGWMISQRKKREQNRNETFGKDMIHHKHDKAQEVFVPVASFEEAKKIESLNDATARHVKKQRAEFLKQNKGKHTQSKLPDEKVKLHNEAQRQFKNKLKGN